MELSRREVGQVAAAGMVAAGVGALASGEAKAADAAKLTSAQSLAAMQESINTAILTANTPEEAYKVFLSLAGAGITDVLAKALAETLGGAVETAKNKKGIDGWENLVKGCAIMMDFGSPFDRDRMAAKLKGNETVSDYFKDILVTTLHHAALAAVTTRGKNAFGGSISVSGTWSF